MSKTETVETFANLDTPESQIEELIKRNWWSSVPLTAFPASWLLSGEQRLDGRFYANEAFSARLALAKSNYERKPLYKLVSNIYYPNRFKRIYATSKGAGTPFLTPSAAFHFRPTSDKLLAKTCPEYDECFVDEGALLVTRSGTVGRITIATEYLVKFALSDDIIRVEQSTVPSGYLYAYLSSWIGQALISKDRYGSAIKHLEPHHIGNVSVPLVDESVQKVIHQEIVKAFQLRDEANNLLDNADDLLYKLLGLPAFDEELVGYFDNPDADKHLPSPKSFVLNTSELDDRFDGSYHVPIARTAIKLVKKSNYEAVQLGNLISRVFHPPRFPRTYVDEAFGVPFLQGSHLPQIRPYDLKFISSTVNKKQAKQCLVKPNWILVTRSGTIGRLGLVPKIENDLAASEHMIRIVAKKGGSHPGYIMAFLATPYGQHQLKSKIYGAVVDELTEEDTEAVWIPNAPYDAQREIGEKVVEAYEKKELANQIEAKAIRQLEEILEGKEMSEEAKPEQEIEWAFTPKLGHEIEPELTKEEFDNFLTQLVQPSPKPSDPKKKGT